MKEKLLFAHLDFVYAQKCTDGSLHLKDIEEQMREKYEQVKMGRTIWEREFYTVHLNGKEAFLLFSSDDRECNYYGLLYMDAFREKYKKEKLFVITSDQEISKAVMENRKETAVIRLEKQEMQAMMTYLSLFDCEDRIAFVDVDKPLGRNAGYLLQNGFCSGREWIAIGAYRLDGIPEGEPYSGNGADSYRKALNKR